MLYNNIRIANPLFFCQFWCLCRTQSTRNKINSINTRYGDRNFEQMLINTQSNLQTNTGSDVSFKQCFTISLVSMTS